MVERSAAMACPVDGTALVMSERQNIEIDYCPTCRGVWLDRGELDKIIERSGRDEAPAPQPSPPPRQQPGYAPPPQQQQQHGDPYRGHDPHYGQRHHKRRKSFLEDLFD
jgi:Zn-finger nucleic acid-binding protein